jgi:hypothetical protein
MDNTLLFSFKCHLLLLFSKHEKEKEKEEIIDASPTTTIEPKIWPLLWWGDLG